MSYVVNIEGFEGQNIDAEVSFWSGAKLFCNGEPAPKGKKRGEMLLKRNDGRQVIAAWKPQLFGLDVPQLIVDEKVIKIVEPLKWYQWVWSGLPIILVIRGGAIGGLAGALGFAINTRVFRSELSEFAKYILSGLVSVLAVLVYFVVALILMTMISG